MLAIIGFFLIFALFHKYIYLCFRILKFKSMALLFTYLLLALTISFLCSLMEAVLLSTPVTYIKIQENTKNSGIRKLASLKQNIDRPLSAILSLNTVAHTVGAAGVGAQATKVFGEVYFGLVSAILTILILVLTEIIPKTLGARYWKKLTALVGHMISATVFIAYPLVLLSVFLTRIISNNKEEMTTSREEISALAEIGTGEGIFLESENKIIQNLIKLKNTRVSEIMTPRVVVSMANEELAAEEFLRTKEYMSFSRIPVYENNEENVNGYILRQAVIEKLAEDQTNLTLRDFKREIITFPDSRPVFSLWEYMLEKKEHIALIVDEFGGMDGIVTMEDIIETLLGHEIVDERDTIVDMQQYAKEKWLKRQQRNKGLANTT